MGTGILVVADSIEGRIRSTSFESTSAAARLVAKTGGKVTALAIGKGVSENARELGAYGAGRVLVVEDERLAGYVPAAHAAAALAAIRATSPRLVFFTTNAAGRDLAPRVAARFQTSVLADCVDIAFENNRPVAVRPVYAGKANLRVSTADDPAFLALRPRMFPAQRTGAPLAAVEPLAVAILPEMFQLEIASFAASQKKKVDLTEADIIVSGGRGMKGSEHFALLEELAGALGATVGASRAVVDAGWRPHEDQVGQTGKTVNPSLYFACGISGAIQHLAGMGRSKVIVAVNKDADAPIFGVANYGIVGDVFEVLPRLTQEVRNLKKAQG
ncbi:MAG: electron transfer flavoprotein subunit alpha/FixB family protein [Planctomycetes bacterium]|nr:electron transfer flavoprotein subunit alpha/FixB family protein [Planctomycetota bacterium]